tara:strand:- start:68996 stop:70822 length:1827 start_codon:yes stop_codon:yes gene_type:complete
MINIKELERKISDANQAYRIGESVMTDTQYDTLVEELQVLDPDNSLLTKVGLEVSDSRKEPLPIEMASMNKVKTVEEIQKWFKSKNIPIQADLILTPKFDGASLCVDEWNDSAWTRGDGTLGQRSDSHLQMMSRKKITMSPNFHTFGEVIMKRSTFLKYSEEFSNPRNLVAGQLNHKTPNQILSDCDYLIYGSVGGDFSTKQEELIELNKLQQHNVSFQMVKLRALTEDFLLKLFTQWNKEYEIDGIIIEINDGGLRESLGRETSSNNPCYARAYKGDFEEVKETKVLGITWQISKKGLLKPVINVETVQLDGVNVSNVTGNNAKFISDMGIGKGAVITVKRSGMVIPMVVSIVSSVDFVLPTIDGVEIEWNESGIELVTKTITSEQRLRQLISFFEILDVDNMGEGTLRQFFNNGFNTPKKVLEMTQDEMVVLDKFGIRKAQKIIKSINDKKNVTLSKLQHASGFFDNLGSKKLLLLENLNSDTTVDIISSLDGFSDISANNYLKGITLYNDWKDQFNGLLNVSKTEIKKEVVGGNLIGMSFVFSGVRRKDLNETIEEMGGRIASGISKNTTHLVMKVTGTGSAKEKKALSLGQTILTVEELEELLN